jgi:hypothetical protein
MSCLNHPALAFSQIVANGNDTQAFYGSKNVLTAQARSMNGLIDNPWSRQTVKTYRGYESGGARQVLQKTRA